MSLIPDEVLSVIGDKYKIFGVKEKEIDFPEEQPELEQYFDEEGYQEYLRENDYLDYPYLPGEPQEPEDDYPEEDTRTAEELMYEEYARRHGDLDEI